MELRCMVLQSPDDLLAVTHGFIDANVSAWIWAGSCAAAGALN